MFTNLGLAVGSVYHRHMLGLDRVGGCMSLSDQFTKQRAEFATFGLQLSDDPRWSEDDRRQASIVATQSCQAGDKCIEELSVTINEQGEKRPQVVPQRMEVEYKLLDHLHNKEDGDLEHTGSVAISE